MSREVGQDGVVGAGRTEGEEGGAPRGGVAASAPRAAVPSRGDARDRRPGGGGA